MLIGIPNEPSDKRLAIVPALIAKFKDQLGVSIAVEKGAGDQAYFSDADFAGAGAEIMDRAALLEKSDLLVSFNPIPEADMGRVRLETALVSRFEPFNNPEIKDKLQGREAYSLDMIPRTTLAQSMDVLSSLASVAGYRAVLLASTMLPRYFPMLITAAGSIRPAQVLVLGAGVAGLQAIATAKRLGASVEAFDTRQAAKEEVESLGARFVEVAGAKDDKGAGGYAVEQSEEFLQRQRAEVQARAAKADVIIATAQVRGRKAPVLVQEETLHLMKKGSVVIDLAASTGGNCARTENGKTIEYQGVIIVGDSDLSRDMPQDASFLFGNNLLNFLKLLVKKGEYKPETENEIVKGARM